MNEREKAKDKSFSIIDLGELAIEANQLAIKTKEIIASNEAMEKIGKELLEKTIARLNEDFRAAGVNLVAVPYFGSGVSIEVLGREVFGSGYGKEQYVTIHINKKWKAESNLPARLTGFLWSDGPSHTSRQMDSDTIDRVLEYYKPQLLKMIKYTLDNPKR